MPDIDPTKSISAARDAIEANLSNVSLESQKYNGTDAAMNRAINERVYDGAKPAYWSTRLAPDAVKSDTEPTEPENQNEEPENQEEDENAEALNGRR
jgi:hypothetical protein